MAPHDSFIRFGSGPLIEYGDVPPAHLTRTARISELRLTLLNAQRQVPKKSPLLKLYSQLYLQSQTTYTRWMDAVYETQKCANPVSHGGIAIPTAQDERNARRRNKRNATRW